MASFAEAAGKALIPLQDLDDPTFDPFAGEDVAFGDTLNTYDKIHELAERSWYYHGDYRSLFTDVPNAVLAKHNFDKYTIFGYEKISQLLPNTEVFSSTSVKYTFGTAFGRTISGMDPPEHSQFRRIFQKAFMPQVVRKWSEGIVGPIVEDLLDAVAPQGHCDLVDDFTLHFPFRVIYRQLDLPPSDIKLFHKLAVAQLTYFYAPEIAVEAGEKLGVYFSAMVRARRENPGDDLVSVLALAEVDGERLPEEVVVSFFRQLVNAGGDTTYRATSVLLAALLTHPDQLQAVRDDRTLVRNAIEEGLRWDCPVISASRIMTRDMEIDGLVLKKGTWVEFVQGSANRDPAKYPDPDKFDILRTQANRHLAFATGPHVCIGQHLARVEMERALNGVLDRFPKLRLDPDMPPPLIRGFNMRVPRHIHVRFD